jgi:hypothetical protein
MITNYRSFLLTLLLISFLVTESTAWNTSVYNKQKIKKIHSLANFALLFQPVGTNGQREKQEYFFRTICSHINPPPSINIHVFEFSTITIKMK